MIWNLLLTSWFLFAACTLNLVLGGQAILTHTSYIVIESDGGLANRLRVLAAYMHIADVRYDNAEVVFLWEKNSACPGHFLSIFESIPHVTFASNSSRQMVNRHAAKVYKTSRYVFSWIMSEHHVPKNRAGFPTWGQIERKLYSRFIPTREVMIKALAFVDKNNMCNCSAMHLRTTDLDKELGARRRTNFWNAFKFVENRPAEERVFLLTDDPETQRLFLNKYGRDKIIVYEDIAQAKDQLPLYLPDKVVRTANGSAAVNSTTSVLVEDHRFTSLEHTLIDVLIAAHAKVFRPAAFSSLSEIVLMFQMIGREDRGWCKK